MYQIQVCEIDIGHFEYATNRAHLRCIYMTILKIVFVLSSSSKNALIGNRAGESIS